MPSYLIFHRRIKQRLAAGSSWQSTSCQPHKLRQARPPHLCQTDDMAPKAGACTFLLNSTRCPDLCFAGLPCTQTRSANMIEARCNYELEYKRVHTFYSYVHATGTRFCCTQSDLLHV